MHRDNVPLDSGSGCTSMERVHLARQATVSIPFRCPGIPLPDSKNGRNRARTCDLPRVKRTLSQLSYAPREAQSIGSLLTTSEVQVHVAEELGEVDRLRQARYCAEPVHVGDLGLDGACGH